MLDYEDMLNGADFSTADLYDKYGANMDSCDIQFRQFGRIKKFKGEIVTVRCREDNALLKSILADPGEGKVLVVDGFGSLYSALIGDLIVATAVDNEWSGVIVNGVVRDVDALGRLGIGIKALGSNPRRSSKSGSGERDVPVSFGGVSFIPGEQLFSDDDGLVVLHS